MDWVAYTLDQALQAEGRVHRRGEPVAVAVDGDVLGSA
jgi:hypothetical protein